jgi:Fe-S cluster assembly protein SufD
LASPILHEPEWLAARRSRAASLDVELPRFKGAIGWEFTELGSGFSLDAFPAAGDGPSDLSVDPVLEGPEGAVELTQVDGWSEAGVTDDATSSAGTGDGPVVLPLDEAAARHPELVEPHLGSVVPLDNADAFVAANEAGWAGGAFVWIPSGVRVEAPILLNAISATEGTSLHRRTLIVVEDSAEVEVWEQFLSADDAGAALHNSVVELVVKQNAHLRYVNAQGLNESSFVIGNHRADVARDGRLEWAALGFGGANGRVRMVTTLSGPGADARVTGAYAPHARQHVDYDTYQEHAAENCVSDLAFRGILNDRSSSVWRGMIKVDPGAQQTDAFQECRNLLLTKRAHADAIPGLEILANDVRCTHAAAVAQIDADQLFYLRSRGLSADVARRLVVEGFLSELVERFGQDSLLRSAVAGALERRLELILG